MKGANGMRGTYGLAGRNRARRTGTVAGCLLVVTVALALLLARIYHLGLAATLVAILGGLPGLYLAWAAYRDAHDEASKTTLSEIADQLAIAIGAQWEATQP